jgi:hypothetical protein
MFFKKPPPKNYLTLIPVQVTKKHTETDGNITLLVPKFKNANFSKWFIPKHKSPYFKIHLDEPGSMLWLLIDGTCNVEEICIKFRHSLESAGKPADQIEERVTKYLSQLFKGRFINFL